MSTPGLPMLPEDDPIEDAAALWQVRRVEGLSAEEEREFDAWQRADPRHTAALARLEGAHALLQRLPFARDRLADTVMPPPVTESAVHYRPPTRASTLPAWMSLAAVLAVAFIAWWQWPATPVETLRFATTDGEYQRTTLADGSVLELNGGSAAQVQLSGAERRVTLASGEAHFQVAHDPSRPFIVTAGAYRVRAVGTAFNVRLGPSALEVIVTEGKVIVAGQSSVSPAAQAGPDQPVLAAGQRVVIASGERPSVERVETVSADVLRQALAWQERKLEFSATPLREVIAQFNAHNRIQLRLADPALGQRPVGGTFAADNVMAFVRLLETAGDIQVERPDEQVILLRKAP